MLRTVKLMALVAMFFVALTSSAQVTTSAMSGVVTDENQEALIGATVTALHTPSGTKYNAVTNMDGRYSMKGMRPGGPYTVTVSYIGYQTRQIEDVTLQLAETYDLDVDMSVNSNTLGEVVVTSEATKFRAEKTGAATNSHPSTPGLSLPASISRMPPARPCRSAPRSTAMAARRPSWKCIYSTRCIRMPRPSW